MVPLSRPRISVGSRLTRACKDLETKRVDELYQYEGLSRPVPFSRDSLLYLAEFALPASWETEFWPPELRTETHRQIKGISCFIDPCKLFIIQPLQCAVSENGFRKTGGVDPQEQRVSPRPNSPVIGGRIRLRHENLFTFRDKELPNRRLPTGGTNDMRQSFVK